MLYAGSDDGVYRIAGLRGNREHRAERVLDADRVFRLRQFDGFEGMFATAESGVYHSPDGTEWTALGLPTDEGYAIGASPDGDQLYAGTHPVRLYVADADGTIPTEPSAWTERPALRELGQRLDWGLERHGGVAQVRSLCTDPAVPDRLVAGIEVGGVHVSEDRARSWTTRRIRGFDAPHTDDIHHLAMPNASTFVASTGSGLYRSTDDGRTWTRLDTGHRQRYFREALVHDGRLYAGAAPASSSSWAEDDDHALFEASMGADRLERVDSPVPDEHPIGWTVVDGQPVVGTHRGTLLGRGASGWEVVGAVPTPGRVQGRYLPLTWFEG